MGPTTVRSSLELMLDAIRLRDDRPEGAPPALPSRPTCRGRLPSTRRPPLPVQLKDGTGLGHKKHGLSRVGVEPFSATMPELEGSFPEGPESPLDENLSAADTNEYEYRAKRWKAVILIQKHVRRWIAMRTFDGWQNNVIVLQSVVRGCSARKQLILLKKLKVSELCQVEVNRDQSTNLQETQDARNQHLEVCPLVLAEIQRRVLQAEAALRIKEEENAILQEQVHQYETRWSDYEARMKSMEVVWQKKFTSLQMSLEATKKSLIADDMEGRVKRPDASPEHHYVDSQDTASVDTHTTECTPTKQNYATGALQHTPAKQARSSDPRLSRNSNGTRDDVSNLVKEFEHRRQAFENKAAFLAEPISGNLDSLMDPYEELRKLKVRVSDWQKDYKVRLQETTRALQKFRNPGTAKAPRKWWAIGLC